MFDERFEFAKQIAISGGRSTLQYFQQPNLAVDRKGDQSPVTVADRYAETHIREQIARQFPDDAVIGEEFGATDGKSDFRWILDPIDGTKSFISGVPLFGTMVAVEFESKPVIGAIFFPGLGVGIYGCTGKPTLHGPLDRLAPAQVTSRASLADAVFVTSEVIAFAERNANAVYDQLEKTCYVTRTWGDCYGYYLVATGRVDLMIDPKLNIWDAAAVAPILAGAGGSFTDWSGVENIDAGEAIGTNPHLLAPILAITNQFAGKFCS